MEQQGSYALMALYFQTLKFSATRILYCQGAMTSVLSVLRVLRSQFPRSWDLWYQASVPSNSYTHGPIYLDLIFSGSYAHSSKFPVSSGSYILKNPSSRVLFPCTYVHQGLYFQMCHMTLLVPCSLWSYVLMILCSPSPTFSVSYVSRTLCSRSPVSSCSHGLIFWETQAHVFSLCCVLRAIYSVYYVFPESYIARDLYFMILMFSVIMSPMPPESYVPSIQGFHHLSCFSNPLFSHPDK